MNKADDDLSLSSMEQEVRAINLIKNVFQVNKIQEKVRIDIEGSQLTYHSTFNIYFTLFTEFE